MISEIKNFPTYTSSDLGVFRNHLYAGDLSTLLNYPLFDFLTPFKIDFFAICLITSGTLKCIIDFKVHEFKENDVIIIPPDQLFLVTEYSGLSGEVLFLMEEVFLLSWKSASIVDVNFELLRVLSENIIISPDSLTISKIHDLLKLIQQEWVVEDASRFQILYHLISVLIYFLYRNLNSSKTVVNYSNERSLSNRFKEAVQEHILVNHTVEYFVDKLNVSKVTLQKATKLSYGKTPKEIIQDTIVLEAKRMLANPENRISQIAYNLGFTEPTNFTKFFKKLVGVTPEMFKKDIQF